MLFKFQQRAAAPDVPKTQSHMTVADVLAFRDTFMEPLTEGFSVERMVLQARIERQRKSEIPKLVMSENGFRVRDKAEMDRTEIELRRVQSNLNKLTESNFNSVYDAIRSEELIVNEEVLKGAVAIIFTKAVSEPVFSGLYAHLCSKLAEYEREVRATRTVDVPGVRITLVLRCQEFHDHFVSQQTERKDEATEEVLRKQNMSNIKFVGELYIRSLVNTKVIFSICETALASSTLHAPSDVGLEMIINLMKVVGRLFDRNTESEPDRQHREATWAALNRCKDDTRVSMRIRFLLQNLLEWRQQGWPVKDSSAPSSSPTQTTSSQAKTGTAGGGVRHTNSNTNNNNNGGDGSGLQQQQQQHRRNNNNNNSGTNSGNNSGGGNSSPNPHRTPNFGSGPHNYTSPPSGPPPPPFHASGTSDEELSRAKPPRALTSEAENTILSAVRDASAEEDWSRATTSIQQAMPGESLSVCLMSAVYALVKKVCLSNVEEDRTLFSAALNQKIFSDFLLRGFAWFLTEAIAEHMSEDCPRLHTRFVGALLNAQSLDFGSITRDVVLRTANYLEVLSTVQQGEEIEWGEEFIELWSHFVRAWTGSGRSLNPDEKSRFLTSISTVKQHPFFNDISSDFYMELLMRNLLEEEDIVAWCKANQKALEKAPAFYEQLAQIVPDLANEA